MTNDVDRVLSKLAEAARSEPTPPINVRDRVMQTVSTRPRDSVLDLTPIACAGFAMAVAATALFALLPTWRSLLEPWAALLL